MRFGDERVLGMKRKVFYPLLLLLLAAAVIIFFLVSGGGDEPEVSSSPDAIAQFEETETSSLELLEPGDAAPEIDLNVLAGEGSAGFEGKPAMVEFIATWCPHCRKMAPVIDRALDRVPTKLIMVGADRESDRKVIRFHQHFLEHPMKGVAVNDLGESVADAYGVPAYPTMAFINNNGVIVALLSGERTKADVIRLLRKAHASNATAKE